MFPIRSDYRMRRTPWVNYALLGVNVAVFLLGFRGDSLVGQQRIFSLMLHPDTPQLHQFLTSVFLHADWLHLAGNMIFLWVFGNAINDRFGHAGYLAFYLAGGILAGLGNVLLAGHAPMLGASGAIAAVTSAYVVLLPRTRITVLVIFYFITYVEIPSLYFVLFQIVHNIWMSFAQIGSTGGGVAYVAHSSGYLFGIVTAVGMLIAGILPRDPLDLLNLIRSAGRRRRFKRMVAGGYDPFRAAAPGARDDLHSRKWVRSKTVNASVPDSVAARELELRRTIAEACAAHDLNEAAGMYLQLVQVADQAVLSRQNQLDVANQLMASQNYAAAADAYERFFKHYADYEHVGDIFLMLGLLYGRYLHQYDRAEHYLERAVAKLRDAKKLELAKGDLADVRRQRGR